MNIEELKRAAALVAERTGDSFIYAGVEVPCRGETVYQIYRSGQYHKAATLDDAVMLALKFDKRAQLQANIDRHQKEIDEL